MAYSMFVDAEARSRYLALALQSRKMIELLLEFVQAGTRPSNFEGSARELMTSLNSASTPELLLRSLHTNLPLQNFEEATTLDEAIGSEGKKALAANLELLIAPLADSRSAHQSAMDTIHLLYDVETRALHRFNEPGSSQFTAAFAV